MNPEGLIREGERRQRERDAQRLRFEARGRSPAVRDLLLSIANDMLSQEPVPEHVE